MVVCGCRSLCEALLVELCTEYSNERGNGWSKSAIDMSVVYCDKVVELEYNSLSFEWKYMLYSRFKEFLLFKGYLVCFPWEDALGFAGSDPNANEDLN